MPERELKEDTFQELEPRREKRLPTDETLHE